MIRLDMGRVAVLGKLPTFPEYLRVGISDPLVAAFDNWLAQSMDKLMSRPTERWKQAYANGQVHGFVFRKRGGAPGRVLVGALAPSADAAGRSFPLVIAAPVDCAPDLLRAPELVPLLIEPFWVETSQLLFEAPSLAKDELEHRVRKLAPMIDAEGVSTASSYQAWLGDLPIQELWSLIHSPAQPVSDSGVPSDIVHGTGVIRMLLECVRPIRGIEQPSTPLTLRLALGQAGGAAVCFWIDVLRRMAGWRETIPSFYWAHDGATGSMLMHLGEPPSCTLSELWMSSGAQDEICDLTSPPASGRDDWLPPLPPELAAACSGTSHSVLSFLQLLATPH